jgi:hypothetical protein
MARGTAIGYSIRKTRNAADALLCSNPPGRPCIARIRFLLKQALSIFHQSHSDA